MIFQNKDGECRLYDGRANTPYYHKILFTNANLSGPVARAKSTERLIMDRGNVDSNSHYVESDDSPIMAPLRVTFSCLLEDAGHSATLEALVKGNNTVDGVLITTTEGTTANVTGTNNPAFRDSTKRTLNMEVKWDGTIDEGIKWAEMYFPPEQQTVADGADGVTLSIVGDCYGAVSRITAFTTPATPIG